MVISYGEHMKLEVGKKYITTSGITVTIVGYHKGDHFPFKGESEYGEPVSYTESGNFLKEASSHLGLVGKIDSSSTTPECNEPMLTVKVFKDGHHELVIHKDCDVSILREYTDSLQ